MVALSSFQDAFAAVVRGGSADLAALGLDAEAAARLRIYQANVSAALSEALAKSFPAVKDLVGEAFFTAMAQVYGRAHPPQDPALTSYGAEFPKFIAGFPPAQTLAYLADTARLDWAWMRALFAADTPGDGAAALAGLDGAAIGRARLALHPSVSLLASPHAAYAIWSAVRAEDRDALSALAAGPSRALVWKHDAAVRHRALSSGEHAFFAAIAEGAAVGPAIAAGAAAEPDFHAPETFAGALAAGVLVAGPVDPARGAPDHPRDADVSPTMTLRSCP